MRSAPLKKTKTQESTRLQAGPKMLCLWHGDDHWCHALVWSVRLPPENPTQAVGPIVHVRVVHTDDGRVVASQHRPEALRYAYPTTVKTSAERFELYLKGRLMTHGGNADAYAALGVEKTVDDVKEDEQRPVPAELAETYDRAARLLGTTIEELEKKYGHLNNGLQMMNLRNRLRARGHNT